MAQIDQSLLFTLPGELRNQIYTLVLAEQDKIVISSLPGSDQIAERINRPRLSLLQASRTLRTETLPVYYGRNTFQLLDAIKSLDAAYDWVRQVQPAHRVLLRKVEFPTFDVQGAVEGMGKLGFELVRGRERGREREKAGGLGFAPRWLVFRSVVVE